MSEDRFSTLMMKHLTEAAERGIRPPVTALLHPESGPARACHADLYGQPLRPGEGDYLEDSGLMVTWAVADAARLLRRHAGLGGSAVANRLEEAPPQTDSWMLMLGEDRLALLGTAQAQRTVSSMAFYDRLPYELCECCAHDEDEVFLLTRIKGGKQVAVYGRTAAEGAKTSCLVGIVAERSLPSLAREGRRAVRTSLPVRDADLVMILRDFYSDGPELVAEAIRALRRAKVKERHWLTQTLNAYPELHALAERVREELGRRTAYSFRKPR
jgi:hypothetical protein